MLFPVIRESEICPQPWLAMQLVEKFQQFFQKERQIKPQGHYWSPERLFVCYFVDPHLVLINSLKRRDSRIGTMALNRGLRHPLYASTWTCGKRYAEPVCFFIVFLRKKKCKSSLELHFYAFDYWILLICPVTFRIEELTYTKVFDDAYNREEFCKLFCIWVGAY